jgi:hypothetical protein
MSFTPRGQELPRRPILSPDPVPRCPRCEKPYHASHVQRGTVMPECQRCYQRWWAMLLRPGPVLEQLAAAFEDEAHARRLMQEYQLPETLTARCFWQFPMRDAREVHEHLDSSPTTFFQSMRLLPHER